MVEQENGISPCTEQAAPTVAGQISSPVNFSCHLKTNTEDKSFRNYLLVCLISHVRVMLPVWNPDIWS